MKRSVYCALAALIATTPAYAQVVSPSDYLKMEIGADRTLADYGQMERYIRTVAKSSPRFQIEEIGQSTEGRAMIAAVISTPENLARRAEYQQIAARLSDPRGLTDAQIASLTKQGKAIVVLSNNIHSSEIGSSQMSLELVHKLASEDEATFRKTFDNIIVFMIPSLNPDGQVMVTDWYRKMLGTKYEGGPMPWLYHHYVGHDNNRDWYMLTQAETKNVTKSVYKDWHASVWIDIHQMKMNGARLFVPPYADPIAPSVDPIIWRGVNLIGTRAAWDLERNGKTGVVSNASFDVYYPGSVDSNPEFKNVYGLIVEVASARMATPVQIDRTQLAGGAKGFSDYKVSSNFPSPWPGGTWRLRDIMDYELISSRAMLDAVSDHKEQLMQGTAVSAKSQIAAGTQGEYWRIPRDQRDPVAAARLAHLLDENAIEVLTTPDAFLVPTAQPLGKFANELLTKQTYPEVRADVGSPVLAPFDVTTWTLPMMMNVKVDRVALPNDAVSGSTRLSATDWPEGTLVGLGSYYAFSRDSNSVFKVVNAAQKAGAGTWVAKTGFEAGGVTFPAGSFIVENKGGLAQIVSGAHAVGNAVSAVPTGSKKIGALRIGLYKPWRASMDEGWTRWIMDQYGFKYANIANADMRKGKLRGAYDVIILPDVGRDIMVDGKAKGEDYVEDLPAPYDGGIGKEGLSALRQFIDAGGTLITMRTSGEVLNDPALNIPVRNVLSGVKRTDFSIPGSMLKVELNPASPINYGLPATMPVFYDEPIAYQPLNSMANVSTQVSATYPEHEENILMSGWAKGADKLTSKAAAVSFRQGQGKVVMFGFGVQNRGQTEGTFKMLFNAIQWAGEE